MAIRVLTMLLRLCGTLALLLGLLFWLGFVTGLVPVHMLVGIVVVVLLWILGLLQLRGYRGSAALAVVALIVGLVLVAIGLSQNSLQPGPNHWIVQVVHLMLGLLAIGVGEVIAARHRRNVIE